MGLVGTRNDLRRWLRYRGCNPQWPAHVRQLWEAAQALNNAVNALELAARIEPEARDYAQGTYQALIGLELWAEDIVRKSEVGQ